MNIMKNEKVMKNLSDKEKFDLYEAQETTDAMTAALEVKDCGTTEIANAITAARYDGAAKAIVMMCKSVLAMNPTKHGIVLAEDLAVKALAEMTKYTVIELYEIWGREAEAWWEDGELESVYIVALATLQHDW